HPHAVARVAVARRLDGDAKLEVLVRRIRRRRTQIVIHAGAAQERSGDAHLLRQLAGDDAHALGADEEEGVVLEHRLVFPDPLLDAVERRATLLGPTRRQVVARAARLVKAVEQPGARERLEEVEDVLALADRVEKDGGATAERAPHVHAPRAEPEAVRGHALKL